MCPFSFALLIHKGVVVYYWEGGWKIFICVSKKSSTPLSRPAEKFNPPSHDLWKVQHPLLWCRKKFQPPPLFSGKKIFNTPPPQFPDPPPGNKQPLPKDKHACNYRSHRGSLFIKESSSNHRFSVRQHRISVRTEVRRTWFLCKKVSLCGFRM